MNILMDSYGYYNYLNATISQGLQNLGHTVFGVEGTKPNHHNYLTPYAGEQVSLFIQTVSSRGPIATRIPNVLLYGEDTGIDSTGSWYCCGDSYFKGFDVVFIRDLRRQDPTKNIFPMNFGIEDRYYCATEKRRKPLIRRAIDIAFLGNIDTKPRKKYAAMIQTDFNNRRIEIEGHKFTQADDYWSQWTATYRPHDPRYYQCLADSIVNLSFMGHGPDCARHWEVMASGGVPVIERMHTIQVPPTLNEDNCVFFSDERDLRGVLSDILSYPLKYQAIADSAWASGRKYHTTLARARYLLRTLENQGLI